MSTKDNSSHCCEHNQNLHAFGLKTSQSFWLCLTPEQDAFGPLLHAKWEILIPVKSSQISREKSEALSPPLFYNQSNSFFFFSLFLATAPCLVIMKGKNESISPGLGLGVHVFLLLVFCFCLRRWASISCLNTSMPSCPWDASFMALDCMHILYCSGVSSSAQCFSCHRWKSPRTGVRTTMRLLWRYLRYRCTSSPPQPLMSKSKPPVGREHSAEASRTAPPHLDSPPSSAPACTVRGEKHHLGETCPSECRAGPLGKEDSEILNAGLRGSGGHEHQLPELPMLQRAFIPAPACFLERAPWAAPWGTAAACLFYLKPSHENSGFCLHVASCHSDREAGARPLKR